MSHHLHDPSEPSYSQIPANRPRHVVFLDETLGGDKTTHRKGLIHVAKLLEFHIMLLEYHPPRTDEIRVRVTLKNPNDSSTTTYVGHGPTIGHGLRDMLDKVNVDYPLGGEYEELPPAA